MKLPSTFCFLAATASLVSVTHSAQQRLGYLMDKQCVNLCESSDRGVACAPDQINVFYEPYRHTKWCLLLQKCVDSGYVLLSADPDPVTGRHEIVMDFTTSMTVNGQVLEFIRSGTTGTAPLVEVEFDDALLVLQVPMANNSNSNNNNNATILLADDSVIVRDPWDDEASVRYSGANTHQVECVDSTTPDIATNNLCYRSDVVVTKVFNGTTIRIESNGCPNHKIMQGSRGVIANSQPDPKPTTTGSSVSSSGGCCSSVCGSGNHTHTTCGSGCGASTCGTTNSTSTCGATSSTCGTSMNSTTTTSCGASTCEAGNSTTTTSCGAGSCGATTCDATTSNNRTASTSGTGRGATTSSGAAKRRIQANKNGTSACGVTNTTSSSSSSSSACGASNSTSPCGAGGGGANSTGGSGCGASSCGGTAGWTAKTINIAWDITTYDRMSANVGDSIVFTYKAFHNLAIHQNASCDETDSVLLAGENDSPFTYVVSKDDIGELSFACQIPGHCPSGQLLTFDITEYSASFSSGCGTGSGTGCGDKNTTITDVTGSETGSSVTPYFQHYVMDIPANPGEPLDKPVYIFSGDDNDVVGILANGVILESHKATWAYDSCVGHSDSKHQYHYHIPPFCFLETLGIPTPDSPNWWINDAGTEVRSYSEMADEFPDTTSHSSPVIGFARDGFPIFGTYDDQGKLMVAADGELDECNGKIDRKGNYGYYLTVDPPFAPPCLRGKMGTFSYRTTNVLCPSEGITTLFIEQKDIIANCETVQFGSAPDCSTKSSNAVAGHGTVPKEMVVLLLFSMIYFFITAAA